MLPVSLAIGIMCLWIQQRTNKIETTSLIYLSRIAVTALILLFTCYAIAPNRFPYRDTHIKELTTNITTGKLNNILTTSSRAQLINQVISAVKLYSRTGDRILAYGNLPMLYFLTDRLPSTRTTWVNDIYPQTLRESILRDMIERSMYPKLVVRVDHRINDPRWPTIKRNLHLEAGQWENDPFNQYVIHNYKVQQKIDGFYIMIPKD